MKRLAWVVLCVAGLCAGPVRAQESTPAAQESSSAPPPASQKPAARYNPRATPAVEISGGYSYRGYSPNSSNTFKLNGGYLSADYNILSWIGIAGEATATVRKQGAQALGTAQTFSIFTAMVGPQVYPLHHRRATVFSHLLLGDGYYYLKAPAFGGFAANVTSKHAFSWEIGGGLDVRVKEHWSLRLIEGDYGETSFSIPATNPRQVGYRVSVGAVYLIGQK